MVKNLSGIYCIRNLVSGRRYVGSAVDIRRRWRAHRSLLSKGKHHSPSLLRSWVKHGQQVFLFEVIESVSDKTNLVEREQYWINAFDSANPRTGFNISPTAGSPLGVKHSIETRAKLSAILKGRKLGPFSDEHKSALSLSKKAREAITGQIAKRNKSDSMREKVRASKLKLYSTQEGIEKLRQQSLAFWANRKAAGKATGFQNFHHSDEAKRKISIAKKGKMTEMHKAAIAESNKRRSNSFKVFGPAIHN